MIDNNVGLTPEGNEELKELTELLRIGLKTVRKIALCRPRDYDKLMDIAKRSEGMASELDEITSKQNHKH